MYRPIKLDTSVELGEMNVKIELPTEPFNHYIGRAAVYFIPKNGVPARYFIEAKEVDVILPADEVEIEEGCLTQTSLKGEDLERRIVLSFGPQNIREDEIDEALSELAS